jgi:hypothetical protein
MNPKNSNRISRPKSTVDHKLEMIQKEKDLNTSSQRQRNVINLNNLNNRILQTIQSKDISIRDISNTNRSKTPFLNSKNFLKERNNPNNNIPNKKNLLNKKEQKNEEIFFTCSRNLAMLNIDGKKINNSEHKKGKIVIEEDKTNSEIKSSLKLFPSFVNIKGCLNIKYRKINYANKMKSLTNKIVF